MQRYMRCSVDGSHSLLCRPIRSSEQAYVEVGEVGARDCTINFFASPSRRYERNTDIEVTCPWGSWPSGTSSSLMIRHENIFTILNSRASENLTSSRGYIPLYVLCGLQQRRTTQATTWRGTCLSMIGSKSVIWNIREIILGGRSYNIALYNFLAGSVDCRPAYPRGPLPAHTGCQPKIENVQDTVYPHLPNVHLDWSGVRFCGEIYMYEENLCNTNNL